MTKSVDLTFSRKLRLACLILLLACTVGCDQTSKHFARAQLSNSDSVAISGGLIELRLAENPGSFLSLGALLPNPIRFILFTLGVGAGLLVLAAYLLSRTRLDLWRFLGLSLVLAGGMSNLLDRLLRQGLVTDFITVRVGTFQTGIFNGADVLIMIGISVIVYAFRKKVRVNSLVDQTER